jgi:hypothetical protein
LSESKGTSFRIAIQGDITQVTVEGKYGNTEKVQMLRASITNNQKIVIIVVVAA